MIDRYDPELAPDPQEWLALDEGERLLLVVRFHRDARTPLRKSARALHPVYHVTVENQLAMDDQEIVRATLSRLMEEGLDRHDAVHAIGSVLAEYIYDILQGDNNDMASPGDNTAYYTALRQLTVEKWRNG